MKLKNILKEEAETNYLIAERLFKHVSNDELNWMPPVGKNWMNMSQLLMHCADNGCGKAIKGFVKGDWGLPEGTSIEELTTIDHVPIQTVLPSVKSTEEALELLEADKKLTLICIADLDERRLLDNTFAAPWGGPELFLFQHLLQMIAHLAQHKGQLFYYLKMMGRNINTNDLWGL
jgi:uncharacterized damage-inducible protein DinB